MDLLLLLMAGAGVGDTRRLEVARKLAQSGDSGGRRVLVIGGPDDPPERISEVQEVADRLAEQVEAARLELDLRGVAREAVAELGLVERTLTPLSQDDLFGGVPVDRSLPSRLVSLARSDFGRGHGPLSPAERARRAEVFKRNMEKKLRKRERNLRELERRGQAAHVPQER